MPRIAYERHAFSEEAIAAIHYANVVAEATIKAGFGSLTIRQLHYIFVGRKYYPADRLYVRTEDGKFVRSANGTMNALPNYQWLTELISKGRRAGLIDWHYFEDRTRASKAIQHWDKPSELIERAMDAYANDKWSNQAHYCEVWVEKESLESVIASACNPLDVRFFACRGYTSDSAMWEAAQRVLDQKEKGKDVHIIHLGDHDPSGIHMSQDIEQKLAMYTNSRIHLERIALNMDQVVKYSLIPDPAKQTDSRFRKYEELYGDQSWELDALDPATLVTLVTTTINKYRDVPTWEQASGQEEKGRATLRYILEFFPDVIKFLRERRKKDTSRVLCTVCGATENNPDCQCVDGGGRGFYL